MFFELKHKTNTEHRYVYYIEKGIAKGIIQRIQNIQN